MAERPSTSTSRKLEQHSESENQEQGLFNETTSLQVFPTTGKPDIRNLSNALKDVCNWYQLGIQLGIPTSELRKIEKDFQGSDRQMTETLDAWLHQTPSCSWSDVVSALQQMGENTVAESVRQKYIRGVRMIAPSAHNSKQTSIGSRQDSCASTSSAVSDDVFTSEDASVSPRPNSSSQSESSQKSPFGCGCGECTFFSFIESGCPKPITSTTSFLYLDMKGLTDEQKQDLEGSLMFESRGIMLKFQHVVSVAQKSLMRRGVTVDELLSILTILETFDPVKKEPMSPNCYTEVVTADTIPKVFRALSNYVSFFNYDIIELIIDELGTQEDKQELQKYKDKFQLYAKRRIYQCLPQFGPVSETGQTDIFVKVDAHYESYTVQELRGFRHRLSEILRISSQRVLHLCRVEKGCFQLTFQVPSVVQQRIFPLSSEQERALEAEGVIKLTCGNYEFVTKDSLRTEGGADQQTLESGGYDCEFVTPPPAFLRTECPICKGTFRKPMQTNCGHIFCETCIERVHKELERCPECNEAKFTTAHDKRLQKLLNNLQVHCTHQSDGCDWTGELGKLDGHLDNQCTFGSLGAQIPHTSAEQSRHLTEKQQKQTEEQEKQLQKLPMKVDVKQHMTHQKQKLSSELPLTSYSKTHSPQIFMTHHFTMKKFALHKGTNAEWYSDPFYTHQQGYKLCVRIDANGYKKQRGTHMSVFICLMKGDCDDELSWPFHGKIAVELLDQNAGNSKEGKHHRCTICYDENSDYRGQRVVLGDKRLAGEGEDQFIPHSKLQPDQDSTVQYLKDDCLQLRVSVLHVELPAPHESTKLHVTVDSPKGIVV